MAFLRRAFSGTTDLAIAGTYFWVAATGGWQTPLGETLLRAAIMEFWAIHAGGFLCLSWLLQEWDRAKRIRLVLAIAGGYTLILGVASLVAGAWWPLGVFWALTANRAVDPILRDRLSDEEFSGLIESWGGTIVLFVCAVVTLGFVGHEAPVVLTLAGVYFTGVGISEMGGWWWVRGVLSGRDGRRGGRRARWREWRRRRWWKRQGWGRG
jgi:hypothetical protein